jgi:uncharacterized Zn finger protein (UPF0148 family)
MSDFDREAERERLREKYERDQERRESTQRMSELLLRGATMTDSHCDTCGDPVFRYEGQEFCATCQAEGGAGVEAADEAEASPDTDTESSPDPATPEDEATRPSDPTGGETGPAVENGVAPTGAEPTRTEAERPEPRDTQSTSDGPASDLAEARASLARTVSRFARRAEATDSPREAADHLAAAREAAEALSALDRR